MESLNLPLNYPSKSDIEELINNNGSFSIEKMEIFPGQSNHFYDVENWPLIVRAGLEAIIRNHFGNEMVEDFFARYTKKHADNLFAFDGIVKLLQINIVLKRKVT